MTHSGRGWLLRVFAAALALFLCAGGTVMAADTDDVPYYSYTYWEGTNRYDAVPMRHVYEATHQINADSLGLSSAIADPQYLTLSPDKSELYVVDSGNGRILVVDTATETLVREIDAVWDGGEQISFVGASGLYVSESGDLYIADTDNARVIITDAEGQVQQIIRTPSGVGVPSDLDFRPVRVQMDRKGYMYVVSRGCYYGLLVYDENREFLGFHGSYTVEGSLLKTVKSWITDLFMTNEKSDSSQKKLPAEIIDIAIDGNDMLYTLSANEKGQIKRLGLNGNQTLNYKFGFTSSSGNTVNFGENPSSYWHKHYQYSLIFTAMTIDEDGFMYAVDSGRSRVFMYDQECRVMSAFSTGYSIGEQVGTFITPTSIACGNGKMYVLDFVTCNVTVFDITEYGSLYKQADTLTIGGEYEQALPLWQEALRLDANNQRAYEGIGKAMLSQKNYDEAMEYARLGNDQQTYSQAFSVVQKEFMSRNFWWIFLLCLAAFGGIAALLVVSKRRKLFRITNPKVRAALTATIHPFQSFQSIKYQKNTSIPLAILFVVVFYIASVSEDLYGGFMYVLTDTSSYNALYTLLGTVGVLMLWVLVNWALCTLSDGKGTFKEVFTMSAYCMMPLILYSVVFIIGSHLIASTGTATFALLNTAVMIYTVVMLLIGMTVIHEYSFFKAVGMAVVTLLGMLLAAFVIFSLFLLSQQFITFIISVINEIILR